MIEIILSINEEVFGDKEETYSGFTIKTNLGEIKLGITNGNLCCENWGYLMSQDDLSCFIGAHLLDYFTTTEQLETVEIPELYEGAVIFVTFVTTAGEFQFAAYNEHNGYYGHEVFIQSDKFCERETI